MSHFDPTDPLVVENSIPHEKFDILRQSTPIHWVKQKPGTYDGMHPDSGDGYWALTRHQDVAWVSKNSKLFSTAENGAIIRFAEGMTREQVELQRTILINQDAPEHTHTRSIISRGFTPRAIDMLQTAMERRAEEIVAKAVAEGEGNFVEQVAAELPLQAIAELLGVPQKDRHKIFDWSNQMLASEDPDISGDPEVAAAEILGYSMEMAAQRRAQPQDDIVTKLIEANKGDRGLTEDEFGFFVILLAVAGNETTRNAISHGMHALLENPDQWEMWKQQQPATAVEEILRWSTPVTVFQRTAIEDVTIGDQVVRKNQRVALFYAAANRDPEVFINPHTFDITRDPNPHVAFGGHGAHYCIGANLARQEIALIFAQLAQQAPDIKLMAQPRRLRHPWVNGIKELHVKY